MAEWGKILSRGNVEDRRSSLGGFGAIGIVGAIIVTAISFFANPSPETLQDVLGQLQQSQGLQQSVDPKQFEGADSYETFASTVLGSNNDLWKGIFRQSGLDYQEPKLVLFRQATQSGCGLSSSRVGPHYCTLDSSIYLDETFFDELTKRFGAKGGDVAEAYVISHEVAHHVQQQLGIMEKVQSASQGDNQASINLELQADCFAGIWARSVADQGVLEKGEVHEAIDAAAAVGDDRIQEAVQGQVNPETWTHGSSKQRVEWFNRGFDSARPTECSTF